MSITSGTLYVVATPLGNLGDITHRALLVLREVDRIVCEDTRVTKRLLFHFEISKPLLVLNAHTSKKKRSAILDRLADGENLALVTDAGTPGVSDPGGKLIANAVERFGGGVSVIAVPGASAIAAALSVAGVPANRFFFAGYPPNKKGRSSFMATICSFPETVVLYESKHRIRKTLHQIFEQCAPGRRVVIARELTKMYEEVVRGVVSDLPTIAETIEARGEFVIVIEKP